MITMKFKSTLSIIFSFFMLQLFAQNATELRKKQFNLDDGIAIGGYDPVAYFIKGAAAKGKKDISLYCDGITYRFSSIENKEAFKKNPAGYEPQYGGWCAYAMGHDGSRVDIDPETFKIVNGKLYLFYNRLLNNTLKSWNKNETTLRHHADVNWQKIFH